MNRLDNIENRISNIEERIEKLENYIHNSYKFSRKSNTDIIIKNQIEEIKKILNIKV